MQKQTSPALEAAECNLLALRQAARHASQLYDSHLAKTGLRGTQYSILSRLNRLGPLSINELAKAMVMDRTTLGRAVRARGRPPTQWRRPAPRGGEGGKRISLPPGARGRGGGAAPRPAPPGTP